MDIWRSLSGMLTAEITSADPSAALTAIQSAAIPIYDIEKAGDLTIRFRLSRRDKKQLKSIAEKRGDTLRFCGRQGVFWTMNGIVRRPVLLIGMAALLGISCWVPSRVFFIRVEGNVTVPTNQIIEQAQKCGIGFGASRREVRSEKMKNALLGVMPQLQWAGVNTYGCVALITVRERNDLEKPSEPPKVSSIIAIRDGIIRDLTVLNGNALCKPGQAVKAGQVLISGYTDCGICIQATHARGEIYAETQRELTAFFPTEYASRMRATGSQKKYSLIIGKKRINFFKGSGISCGSCAKIYKEQYVNLPGGFRLPVALVTEEYITYEQEPTVIDAGEQILYDFAKQYLAQRMIAGKICTAGETITPMEGICRLDGVYSCYEMIGITRIEESLTDYGKNN